MFPFRCDKMASLAVVVEVRFIQLNSVFLQFNILRILRFANHFIFVKKVRLAERETYKC